jgi:mono/diheme cytochrome c family protein
MKRHHRRARGMGLWLTASASLALAACEQPNPLQQAELIGEMPNWGQNFGTDDKKDLGTGSLLADNTEEGRAPTGPSATAQTGGSAVPGVNPMAKESWGGGNAQAGKRSYINQCAMCHGDLGQGGERMGLEVPTLRDPAWHDKVDDGYIGSTIAHGKGGGKMPAFIGKLSKRDINDLIAYVRTLKQPDEEGGW